MILVPPHVSWDQLVHGPKIAIRINHNNKSHTRKDQCEIMFTTFGKSDEYQDLQVSIDQDITWSTHCQSGYVVETFRQCKCSQLSLAKIELVPPVQIFYYYRYYRSVSFVPALHHQSPGQGIPNYDGHNTHWTWLSSLKDPPDLCPSLVRIRSIISSIRHEITIDHNTRNFRPAALGKTSTRNTIRGNGRWSVNVTYSSSCDSSFKITPSESPVVFPTNNSLTLSRNVMGSCFYVGVMTLHEVIHGAGITNDKAIKICKITQLGDVWKQNNW